MDTNVFTLTRYVGRFEFPIGTPMAQAKLIADSIQGQILTPNKSIKAILSNKDAYQFVGRLDDVISGLPFVVQLKPEFGGESLSDDDETVTAIVSSLRDRFRLKPFSSETSEFLRASETWHDLPIERAPDGTRVIREAKLHAVSLNTR